MIKIEYLHSLYYIPLSIRTYTNLTESTWRFLSNFLQQINRVELMFHVYVQLYQKVIRNIVILNYIGSRDYIQILYIYILYILYYIHIKLCILDYIHLIILYI